MHSENIICTHIKGRAATQPRHLPLLRGRRGEHFLVHHIGRVHALEARDFSPAVHRHHDPARLPHAREACVELPVSVNALGTDEDTRALERLPLRLVDGVGKSEADGELAAVQIEGEAALVRLT